MQRYAPAVMLLCIAAACAEEPGATCLIRDINEGWRFRRAGDTEWHDARVPGCVHLDLLASGMIDDPFYRDNERTVQWIEREDWEYRATVTVDAALLERDHVEIVFEGLDTYARVYVNDSLVIEADNMFRAWTSPCKKLLRPGGNDIAVRFVSPVTAAHPAWEALPRELPGGPRVLTRKAAYHYGWDWGPRLVTSGIWRPVRLRAWSGGIIEEMQIVQTALTAGRADLIARFFVMMAGEQNVELSISARGAVDQLGRASAHLGPGRNEVAVPFSILEPKLWWTNGLGEAHLYELEGVLTLGDGMTDRRNARIGIRTVEIVTGEDEHGSAFFVRLNGVPVFMKGANYIPPDYFVTRVTPQRYAAVVRSARDANMNMLRVWGGGIYENDIFYDLCDENGILVWQDFMFACGMYPGDGAFVASAAEEAAQNVKRLRNHPCIALWCGNNEIEEGWHNWGWQAQYGYTPADSAAVWRDYVTVFHELLPGIVAAHDSGRFYWPSSPRFGRADPRSRREGDAHYWGVWHDGKPFEAFVENTGRFMSEYGFQSFPAAATIATFTDPGDRRIESAVMRAHQKHPRGNDLVRAYMERWYRVPDGFEDFLYASQVLQAEGMKIAFEAHRRAMPRCMGSLYWQLCDCWPVASWSSIDYAGRWKALHYAARRAFRSVLVSPLVENGVLRTYVVSDKVHRMEGRLHMTLITFAGEPMWEKTVDVMIEANTSRCCDETGMEELPGEMDPRDAVLRVELSMADGVSARNSLYFLPPKELLLPAADIAWSAAPAGHGYRFEITADRLARSVFLHIDGVEHFFTDNFFDLLPGDTVSVDCRTGCPAAELGRRLKIFSLADTYDAKGSVNK